jgi:hypothetical protein
MTTKRNRLSEVFSVTVPRLLCDCDTGQYPGRTGDADWARFSSAAVAAGYPSGQSCANECGLWGLSVSDAIRFCSEQEVCE